MNDLTYKISQFETAAPSILFKNHEITFSDTLPFKNSEVSKYVSEHCELVSSLSNRYVEFT